MSGPRSRSDIDNEDTPGTQVAPVPILVVTLSLDTGGAERHLSGILPMLATRGWPITIYCMNRLGAFADDVRAAGVEVIGPPKERRPGAQPVVARFRATASASLHLFRVMRRLRPRIVHFFLPEAYIFGAPIALATRIPVRIMSRRGLNLYQRNWPAVRAIERRLHSRMTGILANSRCIRDELIEEGCNPTKTAIIYNGVALAGIGEDIDRSAVRASLGLPPGAFTLITVATLIPYKGHADLLQALAGIAPSLPTGWRLLCIGRDEGARRNLEQQAKALHLDDNVLFLGERHDVASLLAASDISVLPSHEEGFSNAVIEAMASGLPQVVTAVGGNDEAVVHGKHGFVVPPRSPERLGEAILTLFRDPALRGRMAQASRQRAKDHYSMEACVNRYEAAYQGVLAGLDLGEIDLT